MKTKLKLNADQKAGVRTYGKALIECLKNMGIDRSDWEEVWTCEDDEILADGDIAWILGWFVGVCESEGCSPDALIDLGPVRRKARPGARPGAAKLAA